MHRKDKFDCWRFSWDGDENNYEEYDLYIEGVDYCVAYRDEIRNPIVVLVKGDKSVHAKFFQTGKQEIPLQQWAQVLADSL